MNLHNLRPFIPSGPDFHKSQEFFLSLGFEINWGDDTLCEMQFGDMKFLLQNFANLELQQNLMVYVNVDDLNAWYEHLKKSIDKEKYPEVKFSAPEERPWGETELHLIDVAGVCWHFA